MRILHIGLSETLGGIERFLINLYNNSPKEFKMDFIAYTASQSYAIQDLIHRDSDYKIYTIAPFSKPWQSGHDIYRIIKNNKYDVVHIHKNSLVNSLPIFVAKLAGVKKIVLHSHNSQPSQHLGIIKSLHGFNKWLVSHFQLQRLACSHLAGNWLFYSGQYKVIHNAINIKDFAYNPKVRAAKRKELGLENYFCIGCIARISQQKNQLFLLDIFKEVLKDEKSAILLFVGGTQASIEGERYVQNVRRHINELGIERNVKFLGEREDVKEIYQAIDVFVLPSKYEGLCIAAIEAQCTGLPTILSTASSSETFITNIAGGISLLASPQEWAKRILSYRGHVRRDSSLELAGAGYEMKTEVRRVLQVYKA